MPTRGRQRIPRPQRSGRGAPAPWEALPPQARQSISLEHVRAALTRPPEPVIEARPAPLGSLPAAVLAPVFELHGDAHVILTRRAASLRAHTGEVAFPGGRIDPGETAEQAAVREAHEEIGLDPADVTIIGELAPIATMGSRSSIRPFVGTLDDRPLLRPNPAEVERVFDVAISELLARGVFREERWQMVEGDERPMYFFDLADDIVWGATARMLYDLLARIVATRR